MSKISKFITYTLFLVAGVVMGLIITGAFIENRTTLNGIAMETLSKEQISEIISRNPISMKSYDSVVIGGEKVLTVEGVWLTWVTFLAVTLIFVFIGHVIIMWRNKKASPLL